MTAVAANVTAATTIISFGVAGTRFMGPQSSTKFTFSILYTFLFKNQNFTGVLFFKDQYFYFLIFIPFPILPEGYHTALSDPVKPLIFFNH
jgi:hypothetical protein